MWRRVQPVLVPCAVAAVFFALGDRAGPWLDRPGRELPAEARTRHANKPLVAARLRLTGLPQPHATARAAESHAQVPPLRLSLAPGPAAPPLVPHSLAALSVPVLRPRAEPALAEPLQDLGPAQPEPETTPVSLEPGPVEPASSSAEPPVAASPTPEPKNPEADAKPSVHTGTDPDSNVDYYEVNNLPEAEGQAGEAPQAGRDVNMIDDPGLVPKGSADDTADQGAQAAPDKTPSDTDSSMTPSDN